MINIRWTTQDLQNASIEALKNLSTPTLIIANQNRDSEHIIPLAVIVPYIMYIREQELITTVDNLATTIDNKIEAICKKLGDTLNANS